MTFRELLQAERREPAYLPPPSREAVEAYISALKNQLSLKEISFSYGREERRGS
jgi:hypothetical protein